MKMSEKNRLEALKKWREEANWQTECYEKEFFRPLDDFIIDWWLNIPNLQDIFEKEEIDVILIRALACAEQDFIEFVIRTGYTDVPDVDKDGKPVLRRTTALHHADRRQHYRLVKYLFQIYDKFDVNYVDENGVTHFHVACKANCKSVAKKFLEFGQDPNCLAPKFKVSLLHSAVKRRQKRVVESMLRRGVDPNLANAKGMTSLHAICEKDDHVMLEYLFEINEEIQQTVDVDVQDKNGNTPLHLALQAEHHKIAEYLLGKGASPNLANVRGFTALHTICNDCRDQHALAKTFFEICNKKNHVVKIDARDYLGRTPLQLAVANLSFKTIDVLLQRGADLSSFALPTMDDFYEVLDPSSTFYYFKSYLAMSTMELVELLEKKGYELDRKEALTIMALLAKFGLIQKSEDLEKRWYDDERIAKRAKNIKINSSQSMYDLV